MSAQPVPAVDEIVTTFRSPDFDARRKLIDRCPPTRFTDMATMAASWTTPGANLQSLQLLADSYAFGGPEEFGVAFGAACYTLAREAYEGPLSVSLGLLCAGSASVSWTTSLSRLGRHQEARDRCIEVIRWLDAQGDTSNIDSVRLRLVEADFALEDFDDAQLVLESIDETRLPPFVQVNYRTLVDRLKQYKEGATTLASERVVDPRERLRGIFSTLLPDANYGRAEGETDMDIAASIAKAGEKLLQILGGSEMNNDLAVGQRITTASMLFADPIAGRDPERIAETEKVMREALDWSLANNYVDGVNDASWNLYLCCVRTQRDKEAVDHLQRVRANIERARSKIADPDGRAGIMARFPKLYPALVTLLYRLNRPSELLEAVEANKGRVLADMLAKSGAEVLADESFATAVRDLPAMLRLWKAHYATYFVDDDCVYVAVIDPRDGEIATARVDLSKATLDGLARDIRQAANAGANAAQLMPADLGERFAPLLEPLHGLLDGDKPQHVCYSPDDALHVLPLQAATFQGAPLVKTVSVSRVHGAHVLRALMRNANRPWKRCVVVEVPAAEDAGQESRLKTLAMASEWLRAHVGIHLIARERADLENVQQTELEDCLVHMATHGTFPESDEKDPNPYRASGLLLAAHGKLPSLAEAARGNFGDHLLSPQRLMQRNPKLNRSQFTLQACVSGLSREGLGGDALGLEWALFQLGASSILSTHWNVSAKASGAFAIRYYAHLLTGNTSRAAAWRNTVLEFLARTDNLAKPYYWAAFSLSGDWR